MEEYEGPLESAGNIQSKVGDQWTQNKFRHLVNNSIGKKSSTFKNSFVVEETNSTIVAFEDTRRKYLGRVVGSFY